MLDLRKICLKQRKILLSAAVMVNESVFWWAKQITKLLNKIEIVEKLEGINSPHLEKLLSQLKSLISRSEFENRNMNLLQKKILKLKDFENYINESKKNKEKKT